MSVRDKVITGLMFGLALGVSLAISLMLALAGEPQALWLWQGVLGVLEQRR